MVAGGLTGMLMADFGADVVKVEQPGTGDPLRQWATGGEPFWRKVYARNKRFITLDLKTPDGQQLLGRMLPEFDVMLRVVRARHDRESLALHQLHDLAALEIDRRNPHVITEARKHGNTAQKRGTTGSNISHGHRSTAP
jgi:hypothetical protein